MYATGNHGLALITIDLDTGSATTIGSTGYESTYGTAFTPDGTLWTIVDVFDLSSAQLARFDLASGAATPVAG